LDGGDCKLVAFGHALIGIRGKEEAAAAGAAAAAAAALCLLRRLVCTVARAAAFVNEVWFEKTAERSSSRKGGKKHW
jgi:hypothetical protein